MKIENNMSGKLTSFKAQPFQYVRPISRETFAQKKLREIFSHAGDELKLTNIDSRNSVLKDSSGKVYLKIKKFTEFISDSSDVKNSKQAVKSFTRELYDAKDNLIKRVKRFYNSLGMYKIEVWDSDGKTLLNEVIGAPMYGKRLNPSNTREKQTFIKAVYNYPLKNGNSYELIKYYQNEERPLEKTVFNSDHNIEFIDVPKYNNGKLVEIMRLSKSRKLLNVMKVDQDRDPSKLNVVNNSVGWNIYK